MRKRDPGQDGSKGGGQGGMEDEGEVWESGSIDGGEVWWSRDQSLSMYRERNTDRSAWME